MKQKAFVAAGIVVGVLLALLLAVSVASADPPPDRGPRKPDKPIVPKARIIWSTNLVSQTLSAGQIYTATVTFTATQTISNAVITIAPNAPVRVKAIPSSYNVIQANTPTTLQLQISVPQYVRSSRPINFNSLVSVRVGRTALPQHLRVHVTVPKTVPKR